MDSKHQFHISYEAQRVDKNGVEGSRNESNKQDYELKDYLTPTTVGYGYFPNVFFGIEAKYSSAKDVIKDDLIHSSVEIDYYQLGAVVRQPIKWFLPYAKFGLSYYEGYESIYRYDTYSSSEDKFHGMRPYAGAGVSVFIPVFNWGHELEIGAGYTYQLFGKDYSISSVTTVISYHFL